nr:hypothetical protein Iba_chr13fCG4330 [Ipomoea batatas]
MEDFLSKSLLPKEEITELCARHSGVTTAVANFHRRFPVFSHTAGRGEPLSPTHHAPLENSPRREETSLLIINSCCSPSSPTLRFERRCSVHVGGDPAAAAISAATRRERRYAGDHR